MAWAATSGHIANALALAALRGERTAIPFATDPLASEDALPSALVRRLLPAHTHVRGHALDQILKGRARC